MQTEVLTELSTDSNYHPTYIPEKSYFSIQYVAFLTGGISNTSIVPYAYEIWEPFVMQLG